MVNLQDLLLGVADLNSDESVAAAESTMCGIQLTAKPVSCNSSSEGGESDASDNEGDNSMAKSEKNDKKTEDQEPKKKRQKIVELN
jgi:hypothetical protein